MPKIKKMSFSILLAVLLCTALLAVSAMFVWKFGSLNDKVIGMFGLLSGVLSVGTTSIFAAKWIGERGLVHGLLLSAVFSLFFILISTFMEYELNIRMIIIRVSSFTVSGALGGMIGVNGTQHIRF